MNLKKIEVYGFKSFADKLEMKFDKPITAIVGPNGCGKSNVSDAIRWVLGEQSARVLRGKSMQDLIFSGTERRKSMSYCEASLIFDNTNRIFPIEMDEVVISRKLYRSGESEYLLNRQSSRLKDISDLLRDAGLGREGYSIVGQGRMDAILNAKPDDRRAIFEEALGISKFRVRKVETERKLEKNKDNMSRLYDIMTELDRQLGPLKKNSENAKKYLQLAEELKYHEINAYIYGYDNASLNKSKIYEKIKGIEEELNLAELKLNESNADYERLLEELSSLDMEKEQLSRRELEISVQLERQNATKAQRLKEEIAETEKELKEKKKAYDALTEQLASLNLLYSEVSDKINKNQNFMQSGQDKLVGFLGGLADVKSEAASLSAEKLTALARLEEIALAEKKLAEKLADAGDAEKEYSRQYELLCQKRNGLDSDIDEAASCLKDFEAQLFELNKRISKLNEEKTVMQARKNMLYSLTENFEGYINSVKRLLKDAQHDAALSSKIEGVVANLIKVPAHLETAVEAALGGALQNVVTRNEDDAKFLIKYLKDNRYGRITFLPVTSVKRRRLDNDGILKEKGCLGVADTLVDFDKKYSNVVSGLLGSTVVVENIDTAVSLAKKYGYSHRLVTLEGDMIVPSGSISGGSKKAESVNLLGNERELKELESKISRVTAERDEKEALKRELSEKRDTLSDALSELRQQKTETAVELAKLEEKLSKSGSFTLSEREQLNELNGERERLKDRVKEISEQVALLEQEIKKLSDTKEDMADNVTKSQTEYRQLKEKSEALHEEITSVKLKVNSIVANMQQDNKTINIDKLALEEIASDDAEKRKLLETYRLNISDIEKQLRESADNSVDIGELEEIRKQLKGLDGRKTEVNGSFAKADEMRKYYTEQVHKLDSDKQQEEFNIALIDTDLEQLQKRIEEAYDVTYSGALRYKDENYDLESSKENITALRNKIARLGPVSVNSIEDCLETQGRYDEIASQMEDLKTAESDLNQILQELTHEMVVRFNEGFEIINRNFGSVFKELFAGGHARLTIEQDENKSSLDYGIEIEAQPPGKKLQNISLLSGGERNLTAAAILFAILKLRPMPFCVLDEIEAPLDDANAERIASYLRKFSLETQFLVITHKKPTMESADVLYGVTMEEKGVSKMVSVELTEAIKHTA
ncbi:MAG: chromosome segregation protein SMC [Subdoligranulum sp.]|nr:chromosome segregation protein SMC [Subdoligranulum sp.]